MKITIENIGPIRHFEMDLDKDLHILYGENSVGKSYAITLAYLVIKAFSSGFGKSGWDYDHDQVEQFELAQDGEGCWNMNDLLSETMMDVLMSHWLFPFQTSLESFFGFNLENFPNQKSQATPVITVDLHWYSFTVTLNEEEDKDGLPERYPEIQSFSFRGKWTCLIIVECADGHYDLHIVELKDIASLRPRLKHELTDKFTHTIKQFIEIEFRETFGRYPYGQSNVLFCYSEKLKGSQDLLNNLILSLPPLKFDNRFLIPRSIPSGYQIPAC